MHQPLGDRIGQEVSAAAPGMVAVGMRYYGPFNPTPRVDMYIRDRAEDPLAREGQEVGFAHVR